LRWGKKFYYFWLFLDCRKIKTAKDWKSLTEQPGSDTN
jgi:hypothetical protein